MLSKIMKICKNDEKLNELVNMRVRAFSATASTCLAKRIALDLFSVESLSRAKKASRTRDRELWTASKRAVVVGFKFAGSFSIPLCGSQENTS